MCFVFFWRVVESPWLFGTLVMLVVYFVSHSVGMGIPCYFKICLDTSESFCSLYSLRVAPSSDSMSCLFCMRSICVKLVCSFLYFHPRCDTLYPIPNPKWHHLWPWGNRLQLTRVLRLLCQTFTITTVLLSVLSTCLTRTHTQPFRTLTQPLHLASLCIT